MYIAQAINVINGHTSTASMPRVMFDAKSCLEAILSAADDHIVHETSGVERPTDVIPSETECGVNDERVNDGRAPTILDHKSWSILGEARRDTADTNNP